MPIKKGTLEIGAILRGSTVINKIYKGTTVIYELADGTYLELIEDVTISTAVTSVTLSGFTATKEDTLVLVSDFHNNVATAYTFSIYFNNNTTATNYYKQRIGVNATTIFASRDNNNFFADVGDNDKTLSVCDIKLTNDGYITSQSSVTRNYDTLPWLFEYYGTSTFITPSITEVNIFVDQTNGIQTGSRFQLYRRLA